MMLESENNQNENFEENDSVYHYDYINSESNASGNSRNMTRISEK